MNVLRYLAHNLGRTIVLVMHQPRYEIYQKCDNLILLAPGGRTVYAGATKNAEKYFKQLGFKKKRNTNPADFVIDSMSATDTNETAKQLPDLWEDLQQQYYDFPEQNEFGFIKSKKFDFTDNSQYMQRHKQAMYMIIWHVFYRMLQITLRERKALLTDILTYAIDGAIVATMINSKDMIEKLGTIPEYGYLVVLSVSIPATTTNLRLFGKDRGTYQRYTFEALSKPAYWIGMSLCGFLFLLIQPFLYLCIFYPMVSPRTPFSEFYGLVLLLIFNTQAIAQLVSIVMDLTKAQLAAPVITLLMCLLNGFNPELTILKDNFLTYIAANLSFARWFHEALYITEINYWPYDENIIVKEIVDGSCDRIGWNKDSLTGDIVALILIGCAIRLLGLVLLTPSYMPISKEIINMWYDNIKDTLGCSSVGAEYFEEFTEELSDDDEYFDDYSEDDSKYSTQQDEEYASDESYYEDDDHDLSSNQRYLQYNTNV